MRQTLKVSQLDLAQIYPIPSREVKKVLKNGEIVLGHKKGGYRLNPIGRVIWSHLEDKHSIDEIIDRTTQLFPDKATQVREDVLGFLKSLYSHRVINLEWNRQRIKILSWEPGALDSAHLFVTHRCNLSCCHCCIVREDRKELAVKEIFSLLDELYTLGCATVSFTGGEIFTRMDVWKILNYAKKRGFNIKIGTNGTLLTDKQVKMLVEINPLDVSISIYSANPLIHDSITGVKDSFQMSKSAITKLVKHKIPVSIKCMIMKQNFNSYEGVAGMAEKLGVKYQFDPCITCKMNGEKSPLKYRISKSQLEKFVFSSYCKRPEKRLVGKDLKPCGAGTSVCAINAYGDVFPCVMFPLKVGNIRKPSLFKIWGSSMELKRIRNLRVKDFGSCAACQYLNICGPCPGLALLEQGDYRVSPHWSCLMAKMQSKFLSQSEKRGGDKL